MNILKRISVYLTGRQSRRSAMISLIAVNLFPVAGVLFWGWKVLPIMLLYWLENAVVGFFNVLRMIAAGRKENRDVLTKLFLVPFFIFHYGGFTLGHGLLIIELFGQGSGEAASALSLTGIMGLIVSEKIFMACLALFFSHGYSFIVNYIQTGVYLNTQAHTLMVQPYHRVLLMQIVLLIGGMLVEVLRAPVMGLLLFVLLKTGMDLRAHIREHERLKQQGFLNDPFTAR